MARPVIKICGLTRPEDASVAVEAGATHLGVIFAGGPRLVTVPQAKALFEAATAPNRPRVVQRVAVFGDQDAATIRDIAEVLDLDVLQLHGGCTPAEVAHVRELSGRTVWPVVRIASRVLPAETEALAASAGALVLDALVPGQLGGTGVTLDWGGLREAIGALRARIPAVHLMLAGGLRPDSVAEAIGTLSPDGVDVSSGVEQAPGVKDPVRVFAFVDAVRRAAG